MSNDRGSISAFVAVITLTILGCAGLAADGGRIVAAKMTAADHAENAARAGAQELLALRDGGWAIDPHRAVAAAQGYLAAHAAQGTVSTNGNTVTVTVTITVRTTLLVIVGVPSKSVTATRSANPVSG